LPAEKLLASCEGLSAQANRFHQILDRLTHAAVIIDDEYSTNGR
jgi:hypothetical protein